MKEGHNDDDDNDTNILNEAIEAPNDSDYHKLWSQIQILQLIILLGHKSQGLRNFKLFKGTKK